MAYKYKAKDYPYREQSTVESYRGCFDLDNESIVFDDGLDEFKDSDFVMNSRNLNRINDDIDDMQAEWFTSVIKFLLELEEEFQSRINRFLTIKTWSSGSSNNYYVNDVVITNPNDGAYYICLKNCTGAQPLPSGNNWQTEYWLKLYLKGDKGYEAWDINFVGEFNWDGNEYSVKDLVYVKRNTSIDFYVCKQSISYSSKTDPKDDLTHWIPAFIIERPRILILDTMPDNLNFPYDQIFGVVSNSDNGLINIINAKDSTSISDLSYLNLRTTMPQVVIDMEPSDNKIRSMVARYNL